MNLLGNVGRILVQVANVSGHCTEPIINFYEY